MLNKINKSLFVLFLLLNILKVHGQSTSETIEYKNEIKRRTIILDESLNIISETYYKKEQYSDDPIILGTINYDKNQKIELVVLYTKFPNKFIEIDFRNGYYQNYENYTFLKFKNNYEFDGIQQHKNLLVSYKEGKRDGYSIQTDLNGFYFKNGLIKNYPKFLDFNLNKTGVIKSINSTDSSRLFNGFICKFQDDVIQDNFMSFDEKGNMSSIINFKNGLIYNYGSFSENLISNKILNTYNGVVTKNILLNGSVKSNYIYKFVLNPKINTIGTIIKVPHKTIQYSQYFYDQVVNNNPVRFSVQNTSNPVELKKIIDENKILIETPIQILELLDIPIFEINMFENESLNNLSFLKLNPTKISTSVLRKISSEISSFNIGYFRDRENRNFEFNLNTLTGETPFKVKYIPESSVKDSTEIIEEVVPSDDESTIEIFQNLIKQVITNSVILKSNNFNKEDLQLKSMLKIIESWTIGGYGERDVNKSITLFDKNSNKYIKVLNFYEDKVFEGTQFTYFDGSQNLNLLYNFNTNSYHLVKHWID